MKPASAAVFCLCCASSTALGAGMPARIAPSRALLLPGNPFAAPGPGGRYETPASLACVYGLTAPVHGCNPETLNAVAAGGGGVIAVVQAYDDPNAANDLSVFSAQFGLLPVNGSNFSVVYARGTQPPPDPRGDFDLDDALDIELAHALAPGAAIVLVEAAADTTPEVMYAEQVAGQIVSTAGGGEVVNSWCAAEWPPEQQYESDFAAANTVYFASAGDKPGPCWPAVLPNVVGVGGTSINRDAQANFLSETSWAQTGGGPSMYVPRPSYQNAVRKIVGAARGTPDMAAVGNPATGVWVYDSAPYYGRVPYWLTVGGTSVSTPIGAAIVNNAGRFAASTEAELAVVYGNRKNASDWRDITTGMCNNPNQGGNARKGYDFCTGVGAPVGRGGK